MKIATFNINNINKRLSNLAWLEAAEPDVVCLQELKATDSEFPVAAIEKASYGAVWRGQKSWNGVAILARGCEPVVTHTSLPGDPADKQSRYIEAAVNGVLVGTLYAPNGNPQPGPRFKYKLAWMERLIEHAAELYTLDAPVVLAGDYNVVPTDADIYPTKSYKDNGLVQPEPRALFTRLLAQGWIDAIRTLHPDAKMYTFWDYMRNRWQRDAGLRLDHLLLNRLAGKPGGAILGFANLLLRLYREEQPRPVLAAWDTLEVPTYRHRILSQWRVSWLKQEKRAPLVSTTSGLKSAISKRLWLSTVDCSTSSCGGKSGTSAFIDLGDQFLALQKSRTQPADDGRHFGLVVDDKNAVRKALADAGIQPLPGPFLDFLDPWGNRIEIVSYDNVQFTKAPNVLRGMGLTHLSKNEQALKELTAKDMAPN